jgi:hypothetical protein
MRSVRTLLAAALGALACLGCTDDPAGPPPLPPPDSPELILSNPIAPGAEFVLVRNLTDGASEGLAVRVVNGGFDAVGIVANAGDLLELGFCGDGAVLGRKYRTVPRSRPPTIVRIAPPKGRTDVALGVRPAVIFSEPVDPASIAPGIRLLQAGAVVDGEVASLPTAPWAVEFIPATPLEPGTT